MSMIEFSLAKSWKQRPGGKWDYDPPVVCFSSQKYTDDAVRIEGGKMPETWLDGYQWQDLNIMQEAYLGKECRQDKVPDLRRLFVFIRAFGCKPEMWMHVWKSRLPKQV